MQALRIHSKQIVQLLFICLFCVQGSAQTQLPSSTHIVEQNGKYGVVNDRLPVEPEKRKKKKDADESAPLPWVISPRYDSLNIIGARVITNYYSSTPVYDTVIMVVARTGTDFLTCFEEFSTKPVTDALRSVSLEGAELVSQGAKAIAIKYYPVGKETYKQFALQGENGKWVIGINKYNYYDYSLGYDSVDLKPVTGEPLSGKQDEKGTWIAYNKGQKFYFAGEKLYEFTGGAKLVQSIQISNQYAYHVISKDNKFGFMSDRMILPIKYDTIIAADAFWEEGISMIILKEGKNCSLYEIRSGKILPMPVPVKKIQPYFTEVFVQTEKGWQVMDNKTVELDTTIYPYGDKISDRFILLGKNKSLSYLHDSRGVVREVGPAVVFPNPGETYDYIRQNGLVHFTLKSGEEGLKLPDGKLFVHPFFYKIIPSPATDSKIYADPDSKPEEWLYEFTREGRTIIGSIDPLTQIIRGYSRCPDCDGWGYLSVKTAETIKGQTTTRNTTAVQTLKSEKFNVKTGTTEKTYEMVHQQVTTTTPDKTITNSERVECKVCHGKGKTEYVMKWNGKAYVFN